MNIRLFCILDKKNNINEWWSGGGYDLTPFLPYKRDCKKWHKDAKTFLDGYNKTLYKKFSKNCNDYFSEVCGGLVGSSGPTLLHLSHMSCTYDTTSMPISVRSAGV